VRVISREQIFEQIGSRKLQQLDPSDIVER